MTALIFSLMEEPVRLVRTTAATVLALSTTVMLAAGCGATSGNSTDHQDTITIGSFGPITGPDMHVNETRAAMKAAISSINASGGVNGYQLKLDYCDTKFDPNEAAACARQMVEDDVSAVVGPLMFYPTSSLPVLEKGGIPVIASQGLTATEFQSQVAFPLAGVPGWFYGAVALLVKHGATKISVIGIDNSSSRFANQTALGAIKAAGLKPEHSVSVPPNTVDLAPAAAQATAGGVDGVVIATSPQVAPKAVAALRGGGYEGLIASVSEALPQDSVTALGAKAEGVLLTSLIALPDDPSNPSSKQFRTEMTKYQPKAEVNALAFEGWAATRLFAKVASRLPAYDPATVLKTLNNLKPVTLPAFGGFATEGVTSPLNDLPQLLHTKVQGAVVKDGEIVAQGDLFDPFKQLEQYRSQQ